MQGPPGLHLGERFLLFEADRLLDRKGDPLPVRGLDVRSWANVVGIGATFRLADGAGPFWTLAFAVPVARIDVRAGLPAISFDREGLGDIAIEPVRLGWRLPRVDVVGGYDVYAPTQQLNRGGIARSQWTHQLSAGGTLWLDDQRGFRISALASWNIYERKPDVDVTRGQTVQVQGGIGGRFLRIVDLGVASYALWQTGRDRGADLPPALTGQRERAVGLGPEIDVLLPWIRSRLTVRYEWEVSGRARLDGSILVVGLGFAAWQPEG
ncbi:transporter [bacterium]|nr:transporter [bacterium]